MGDRGDLAADPGLTCRGYRVDCGDKDVYLLSYSRSLSLGSPCQQRYGFQSGVRVGSGRGTIVQPLTKNRVLIIARENYQHLTLKFVHFS